MGAIDAHHHLWTAEVVTGAPFAHGRLLEDYGPQRLRPLLAEAGVVRTVLVEAVDSDDENHRLAPLSRLPEVAAVVVRLPIERGPAEFDAVDALPWGHIGGVRWQIGREPIGGGGSAATAVFAELAARGWTWDVVPVTQQHVDAVLRVADAFPELRVVVDHLCRPLLPGDQHPWHEWIRQIGHRPNIAMKASLGADVLTRSPWPAPQRLGAVLDHVLNELGPQRVMLASNWPVVELGTDYARAWHGMEAAARALLTDSELAWVRERTALQTYRITDTERTAR